MLKASYIVATAFILGQACQSSSLDRRPTRVQEHLVFSRSTFDIILPQTVPSSAEMTDSLFFFASPGEYEPISFCVHAYSALESVTVLLSDLRSDQQYISTDNMDLRIVKVWDQAGIGTRKEAARNVPELLLKSDLVKIQDAFDEQGHYIPPHIAEDVTVLTSLPKERSKQFWLTVYVPESLTPGRYDGLLSLRANGRKIDEIWVCLEVLPVVLDDPRQDRIIYYRGSLDSLRTLDYVGEDRYRKQISDIRQHSFTGLTIYDTDPRYVEKAFQLIRQEGFPGPIVCVGILEASNRWGFETFFYGVDEPRGKEKIERHLDRSAEIRGRNGKVVTATAKKLADELNQPGSLYSPMDAYNYRAYWDDDFRDYVEKVASGEIEKHDRREWYYWQLNQEKPNLHRVLAGFYLWKSKMDGIFPYVYQHIMPAPNSPYDDFDDPNTEYKDYLVAYPSFSGPIPTIQWEAVREGIDDLRYLTTLQNLIQRCLESGDDTLMEAARTSVRTIDEKVFSKISMQDIEVISPQTREPYSYLESKDYQEMRWAVAMEIIRLQILLEE